MEHNIQTLPATTLVVAPVVIAVACPGAIAAPTPHATHTATHAAMLLHLDLVIAQRLLHVYTLALQLDILVH